MCALCNDFELLYANLMQTKQSEDHFVCVEVKSEGGLFCNKRINFMLSRYKCN